MKKIAARYIIIYLLKASAKEKILKVAVKQRNIIYRKKKKIRMTADFLLKTMQDRQLYFSNIF